MDLFDTSIGNVLSCFDGVGCGQIALDSLGIKYDNYFASEIDKHAIKVTKHLFPNTVHLGDITKIDWCDLPKIDLLIGGSPCQGFSFAGKQLNFEDPRSKLFFEFVRLKEELNPKWFFLENVKMKKEYEKVITELMGVEPVEINSSLVSAQNRKRLYWTNIPVNGLPKDRGILLKDILEKEVDEKYYLSGKNLNSVTDEQRQKKKYTQINGEKGLTETARQYSSWTGDQVTEDFCVAMRGRNPENPSDRTAGVHTEQRLEPRKDNKTNCLTSVQKDNLIAQPCDFRSDEGFRVKQDGKTGTLLARARTDESCGQYAMVNRPHGFNKGGTDYSGKTAPLTKSCWEQNHFLKNNLRIRRLTPRECGRLQTVPEHILDKMLSSGVSDSQLYKMFGNGWTIEVIKHFFRNL